MLHTKEGQAAASANHGYRTAVSRLVDIKEAVAVALPYSASVIGYGSTFLYHAGALCYVLDDDIRVLDVHAAARTEQVMSISSVVARVVPTLRGGQRGPIRLSLLSFCDDILAFLVELAGTAENWLVAIDLSQSKSASSLSARKGRLRLRTRLSSTRRLFVRHNRSYLYYGTHSGIGYHGFPLWAVHCVDLTTGIQLTDDKPVQLEDVAGSEIGQTVCFGLHHDHLYAVSTQVDFEDDESVAWTSFYAWTCLAPGPNPARRQTPRRTWRRHHREGPINDTWTDLSLQQDEASQRLLILECRREWRDGGSDNCRTYYMHELPSPEAIHAENHQESHHQPSKFDFGDSPDDRPKKRLRRHYHPEYPQPASPSPASPGSSSPPRDFILARTKYHTYNLSASSFLDLVNDPHSHPRSPHDRLRLRTVSRKRKTPIDSSGDEGPAGLLYPPDQHDAAGRPLEHSEERFVSRGTHLWPPENAPAELTRLLCPSPRAGRVLAVADERSLIYSVNHDRMPQGTQALILVNFDPAIRLGLRCLSSSSHSSSSSSCPLSPSSSSSFSSMPSPPSSSFSSTPSTTPYPDKSDMAPRPPTSVVRAITPNPGLPSVREEPALYTQVGEGYWLR